MTNLYAQVKDDKVVNVWDSPPPVPLGEDGWRHAIEVYPEIDTQYQYYDGHTMSIAEELVTITHNVNEVPVEARKQDMIKLNDENILNFLRLSGQLGIYTTEEITAERQKALDNISIINSATTHSELNGIVLFEIRKY